MTKTRRSSKSDDSLLGTLWQGFLALTGGVKPFVHHLQAGLGKRLRLYARVIERRVLAFIFRGTTLFISVLFISIGFLFILMDYVNLSRAVACLCCGLLALVIFSISVHVTK